LDALEEASDYERALEGLDKGQKDVVRKLREAAGDLSKVIGNKRKCACASGIVISFITVMNKSF